MFTERAGSMKKTTINKDCQLCIHDEPSFIWSDSDCKWVDNPVLTDDTQQWVSPEDAIKGKHGHTSERVRPHNHTHGGKRAGAGRRKGIKTGMGARHV